MSKLPKNFEKSLLGVAGLAAVGFAALGFMKSGAVAKDFNTTVKGTGADDASIPEAAATTKATNSLTSNRTVEAAEAAGRPQPVDLFVGIRLFANKNEPNVPIDPVGGKIMHEGIPNLWWLETGADPTFADSPDRDDDKDGFTNKEEFMAKTHPVDDKNVPPLVDKLAYVKDESTQWYVQFGIESAGNWAPKVTLVTPDNKRLENKVSAIAMIKPGDTFFSGKEPMLNRFKYTGVVAKKIFNPRTKVEETVRFGQYEDLKPNKKGDKYESQQNLPDAQLAASAYYDRTAVLDLRAIGYEGKEFKVEERTKFALPHDAPEKNYLLKSVTPEAIEVEYTDGKGATQTLKISKGGTP